MTATYEDILRRARQLPVNDQVELAEAILRNIRSTLWQKAANATEPGLVPLADLSEEELRALADAVVSPERQQQLQALLAENRERILSEPKATALDALLDEVDQVALLKARALYTLQLRKEISAS